MGLFSKKQDINDGVRTFRETEGAYLIDVRTTFEYGSGHIEGSISIPLQMIHEIVNRVKDLSAPLYVYCRSGVRSAQAVSMIREMGYKNVTNIGGISSYTGEIVK